MERRSAIRNFIIISAGASLLPSCLDKDRPSTVTTKNFRITSDQEEFLSVVAQTLIPTTDTPGAKEISAHSFALIMVDDCFTKTARAQFITGMDEFRNLIGKNIGKKFMDCSASQKEELFNEFESKKGMPDADIAFFYSSMKRLTLQAYMSSKYYLTQVQKYQLIPGPYKGCVPVRSI